MSKYSQKGPFAVGVQEIVVAGEGGRDLPVWVWYPTVRPSNQRAGHLFGSHVPYDAHENATPVEEVLPLVLFSHGNGGLAQQSTFVTTHLASWGFAVAAPDHVGNTIAETFEVTEKDALRAMHREAIHNRPEDLRAVLDVLAGTKKQKDSQDAVVPLPKVAVPALGFLGHSFGGWTSLKAASILPVKSAVALAPADEWFVGKKACVGMYPPKVPVLTIAAKLDVLVDFDKHILPLAHKLGPEKSRLVVMPRADHMHFCDDVPTVHQTLLGRTDTWSAPLDYGALLPQEQSHRIINAVTTAFFKSIHQQDKDVFEAVSPSAVTKIAGPDAYLHAITSSKL